MSYREIVDRIDADLRKGKARREKITHASISSSVTVRVGDTFELAKLVELRIISDADCLRAHVLLMKIRGIFPYEELRADSLFETGMRRCNFSWGNYYIGYSISDNVEGPKLIVTDIEDKRKVQMVLMPNTRYMGICSVCANTIVPYSRELNPHLEAPQGVSALCPCHLTRYCSSTCQKKDWNEFGHKRVHKAWKGQN